MMCIFWALMVCTPTWFTVRYNLDTETQHATDHLLVPILLIVGFLIVVMLFINCVKMFTQLTEIERYLLLLFFAICTSALVGFLNHHTYLVNRNAFFIDDNLLKRVTSQQLQDREAGLQRSQQVMRICKDVMFDLASVPSSTFGTSEVKTRPRVEHTVRLNQSLPNTTIQLTKGGMMGYGIGGNEIVNDRFLLRRGGDSVELYESPGPEDRILGPLVNNLSSVKKADLIAVLQYRMELENKYSAPLRDAVVILPSSLFVYQAAMETVGGTASYFVPANGFARAIAFCHSLANFAFFGLFITILIGRHTNDGKRS